MTDPQPKIDEARTKPKCATCGAEFDPWGPAGPPCGMPYWNGQDPTKSENFPDYPPTPTTCKSCTKPALGESR